MTTEDLISYIKKQIGNNISKDLIISKLISVGWKREDIDEGFMMIEKTESKKEDVFSRAGIEIEGESKVTEEIIPTLTPKIKPAEVIAPDADNITTKPEFEIKPHGEFVPSNQSTQLPTIKVSQMSEVKIPEKLQPQPQPQPAPVEAFNPSPVKSESPIQINETPKNYQVKDLPRVAMISSYSKDMQSMQSMDGVRIPKNEETIITKQPNKKSKKWIIFVIIILVILGGAFVFASNSFNIRNLSFSFIKKDPRVLLLNNSKTLASLKSYKTETNIKISTPSIANISAGLVSGEAVSSEDKDTLSINTLGRMTQIENVPTTDSFVTINSSLLQNYISTDIKNNGNSLFISVPDLSQLVGDSAPESLLVKVDENQSSLISAILPDNIQSKLAKVNLYRILSKSISSYLDDETLDLYDQFINDTTITETGEENIKGIDTYRYSISTDRQLAKKLLNKVFENLTYNLTDADRVKVAEISGATTISSFEVWVGKSDNNIYQYKVVLALPLSKVLGFEDKSIGDNMVNVDWTTTYYDFEIANNIFIPEKFTTIDDFIKTMNEIKIKNEVSSFRQYAISLHNVEGSYGTKSNSSGSCMSPVSGSLFSPTGHPKGALESVSSISLLLNKILEKTYSTGTCYSTPNAWSFSVPLSDNYDPSSPNAGKYQSFYCIDNTGTAVNLEAAPTGVVCK